MKVVFVCLGNICRSPMAEAVFRQMVKEKGLEQQVIIDCSATISWEQGNPVHSGTRKQLAKVGISTEGMYSRQLSSVDADADYIIGMDSENMMNIKRMMQGKTGAKIASLLSFAGSNRDIADPWYTGDFEQTYQDVCLGCEALMKEIQEKLQKNGENNGEKF